MPDDAPDLEPTIADLAEEPAKIVSDGSEVDQQPIPDVIEADKYLRANAALRGGKSGWGATRPARVVPPGSTGPNNTDS